MTKASVIIKTQCCGNMLDIPKCELVAKVEKLESDNATYQKALKEIQTLPSVREDESSQIAFLALKACK